VVSRWDRPCSPAPRLSAGVAAERPAPVLRGVAISPGTQLGMTRASTGRRLNGPRLNGSRGKEHR
jgi:hypothetical protein